MQITDDLALSVGNLAEYESLRSLFLINLTGNWFVGFVPP